MRATLVAVLVLAGAIAAAATAAADEHLIPDLPDSVDVLLRCQDTLVLNPCEPCVGLLDAYPDVYHAFCGYHCPPGTGSLCSDPAQTCPLGHEAWQLLDEAELPIPIELTLFQFCGEDRLCTSLIGTPGHSPDEELCRVVFYAMCEDPHSVQCQVGEVCPPMPAWTCPFIVYALSPVYHCGIGSPGYLCPPPPPGSG